MNNIEWINDSLICPVYCKRFGIFFWWNNWSFQYWSKIRKDLYFNKFNSLLLTIHHWFSQTWIQEAKKMRFKILSGYFYTVSMTRWYHGRLDRFQSEERLRLTEKHGSYLVRESDRKPGSYVLSYFGQTGINHFRWEFYLKDGVNRDEAEGLCYL